jgi:hypothetical protein
VGENGSSWTMDIHDQRVDTTMLAGFAGTAVTEITVLRADGVVVTASMSDGHRKTTPIGRVMTVPPPLTGS